MTGFQNPVDILWSLAPTWVQSSALPKVFSGRNTLLASGALVFVCLLAGLSKESAQVKLQLRHMTTLVAEPISQAKDYAAVRS
jgi:hypothetical protein